MTPLCREPVVLPGSAKEYFSHAQAHQRLLADKHRLVSFQRALASRSHQSARIIDVGAGRGILSLYAGQCGAAEVHLLEESSHNLESAASWLDGADLGTRYRYHQGRCSKGLGDPAGVESIIVSETLGTLGINEGFFGSVYDVQKANGRRLSTIPQFLELYAAPIRIYGCERSGLPETPCVIRNLRSHWGCLETGVPSRLFGARCSEAGRYVQGSVSTRVKFLGSECGLILWFVARLGDGIVLSNNPGFGGASWGTVFIPNNFEPGPASITFLWKELSHNEWARSRFYRDGGSLSWVESQRLCDERSVTWALTVRQP